MEFNDLPNEILVKIFRLFSLQSRLQLRIISQRWKANVERLCLEKTSLKLFGSANDARNYCIKMSTSRPDDLDGWKLKPAGGDEDDDLLIAPRHFSNDLANLLAELFPDVVNLAIHFGKDVTAVPHLLANYQHTLTSLSISGYLPIETRLSTLRQINAMTNLKRLYLPSPHCIPAKVNLHDKINLHEELSNIVPRLEHFNFYGFADLPIDQFCGIVEALGPQCTYLRLPHYELRAGSIFEDLTHKSLLRNAHLASSLSHLCLNRRFYGNYQNSTDESIASRFKALRYLEINTIPVSCLRHTLRIFSPIEAITEFNLTVTLNPLLAEFYKTLVDTSQRLPSDRPMLNLKRMTIHWTEPGARNPNIESYRDDIDQFNQMLAFWCPNLESLTVTSEVEFFRMAFNQQQQHFSRIRQVSLSSRDELTMQIQAQTIGRH